MQNAVLGCVNTTFRIQNALTGLRGGEQWVGRARQQWLGR